MQATTFYLRNATCFINSNNRAVLQGFHTTPNLSTLNTKAIVIPASTDSLQTIQRRARNLSDRHAELSFSIRQGSPSAKDGIISPAQRPLSPQGQANPKSAETASRLRKTQESNKDPQHMLGSTVVGDLKVLTQLGLRLPTKPEPPGPEDCCMSGCAVCVHDLYIDGLRDYKSALGRMRDALLEGGIEKNEWPKEVIEFDKGVNKVKEGDEEFEGMDPSMKAFMMMEQRMKKTAIR